MTQLHVQTKHQKNKGELVNELVFPIHQNPFIFSDFSVFFPLGEAVHVFNTSVRAVKFFNF